jgi:apolipoprotein D and lipocalin family protein
MKKAAFVLLVLAVFSCSSGPYVRDGYPQLQSVGTIDLQKYLGKWYEIARYPFIFEDGLVNTTATYSLLDNGHIKVLNEGSRGNAQGKREAANGDAWIPDARRNAEIKVSFFGPFSSDYWVIDLDAAGYSYAMVGSGYNYLWILSRTPTMDDALYAALVQKAKDLGYETGKLFKVPQEW